MDEDKVKLAPEEIEVLAEYEQAIRDIQQQAQGALRLMHRTHGLKGNWTVQGDSLVKAE